MRKLISIVLMCCLVCQCMVQLGIVSWYEINKKYISVNLCENRDKPKMHCNGKCYLKKKLKKAEQQENSSNSNSSRSESFQLVSFILPGQWHLRELLFTPATKHLTAYLDHTGTELLINIFHPPQSAVVYC